MTDRTARVLVIDDEADFLRSVKLQLELQNFEVATAGSAEAALAALAAQPPSAVVVDFRLDGQTGLDVYRAVRKVDRFVPVVLLSAVAEQEDQETLVKEGIDFILTKGGDPSVLPALIRKLVAQRDEVIAAVELWVENNPEDADRPFFALENGEMLTRREGLAEMKRGTALGGSLLSQYRLGLSEILAAKKEEAISQKAKKSRQANPGKGRRRKRG